LRSPFDPPPSHCELKPLQQVEIWDGTTPWAVSRNALYRQLITDSRISADIRRPGYPAMTEVFKELRLKGGYETFDRRDGEEHEFTRRIIMREFTLKRIEAMRPALQEYLDTLFDSMLAGPQPCDIASDVAFPFTSKVICNLAVGTARS
jgi:hypothetical protein